MKKVDKNIVEFAISTFNQLKEDRSGLESVWQQVSKYVRPQRSFSNQEKNYDIYDSTAISAAEYLTSAIWSLVANNACDWFNIAFKDFNQNNDPKLKKWLYQVNKEVRANLNDPTSGFYYKSYEFYADLVCFGTAIFYLGEDISQKKIIYQTMHLKDIYLTKIYNEIDTVIHKVTLTAQEAVEKFGFDNLSPKMKEAITKKSNETFELLHLVLPNKYFQALDLKAKNMKYASYYINHQEEIILQKSGYYEFPYIVARWYTNANQIYGQSPAISALADIKMLNAMSKTTLIAAQKQVDPPILAPNEASIKGIKTAPGGVIYGGIDVMTGNQLLKPFSISSDIASVGELQKQRRNMIKEAFYYSLLLFSYSNNATATEVIHSNEQKLRVLGAKIARIQSEFLYPLLQRLLTLMERIDLLPENLSNLDVSSNLDITFLSSWNKYQKIQESIGINNLNSTFQNLKEFIPDMANKVDWDQILKIVAEGNGIPENIIK